MNTIELVVIGAALGFSRAKMTIVLLIIYNLFMQFITWQHDLYIARVDAKYEAGIVAIDRTDVVLMQVYFTEGFMMLLFAAACLFLVTRISYLTAFVITAQGILSILMVFAVYAVNQFDMNLSYLFDMHSSFNSKFVIIYMLIAWICVYLSRKKS